MLNKKNLRKMFGRLLTSREINEIITDFNSHRFSRKAMTNDDRYAKKLFSIVFNWYRHKHTNYDHIKKSGKKYLKIKKEYFLKFVKLLSDRYTEKNKETPVKIDKYLRNAILNHLKKKV